MVFESFKDKEHNMSTCDNKLGTSCDELHAERVTFITSSLIDLELNHADVEPKDDGWEGMAGT